MNTISTIAVILGGTMVVVGIATLISAALARYEHRLLDEIYAARQGKEDEQ